MLQSLNLRLPTQLLSQMEAQFPVGLRMLIQMVYLHLLLRPMTVAIQM